MCYRRLDDSTIQQSKNCTLVTPKNQSQRGPQRHGSREADQQKTLVPNRDHLNSAYAVMSFVIHFTIVEPELKDVFIVIGRIIYENAVENTRRRLKKGKFGQTDIQALTTQSTNLRNRDSSLFKGMFLKMDTGTNVQLG